MTSDRGAGDTLEAVQPLRHGRPVRYTGPDRRAADGTAALRRGDTYALLERAPLTGPRRERHEARDCLPPFLRAALPCPHGDWGRRFGTDEGSGDAWWLQDPRDGTFGPEFCARSSHLILVDADVSQPALI